MAFAAARCSAAHVASSSAVGLGVAPSDGGSRLWREHVVANGGGGRTRENRFGYGGKTISLSGPQAVGLPQESHKRGAKVVMATAVVAAGAARSGALLGSPGVTTLKPSSQSRLHRGVFSKCHVSIDCRVRGYRTSIPNEISQRGGDGCGCHRHRHPHRGSGFAGTPISVREAEGKPARRSRRGWMQSGYRHVTVSAIGFQPDARVGIERAANGLLRDAASLLVYQSVLQGPAAQAFLRVLLSLRRGEDSLKVIEAYGDFYRQMVAEGHQSWQDYVLDCILAGHDNPFADACIKTASKGKRGDIMLPAAVEGMVEREKHEDAAEVLEDIAPSLVAAAESDLDSLHRLCITETTLSGWVCDVAEMKPEWRVAAATNLAMRQNGSKVSSGFSAVQQDTQRLPESTWKTFGFELTEDTSDREQKGMAGIGSAGDNVRGMDVEGHAIHKSNGGANKNGQGQGQRPADSTLKVTVAGEGVREEWRRKIGGLWKWSDAVPLLKSYYRTCGVGIPASYTELMWKGGKLVHAGGSILRDNDDSRKQCTLSIHAGQREKIRANLERHAAGWPAQHVLVYGASGTGKTWLMRGLLETVMREQGLRTVLLPKGELKTISALLEEISAQPHLRFAILLDDITLRVGDDLFSALKTALDEAFQVWPRNAIVCATSSSRGLVRSASGVDASSDALDSGRGTDDGGPLSQHFGTATKLVFPADEEGFLSCVREVLPQSSIPLESSEVDVLCKQWLQGRTGLSWRALNQFVASISLW